MNITLIGMAGVGKSVIGKGLAKQLNFEFIDIDEIIEKKAGLKLQEVIDQIGEGNFLEMEKKTILELDKVDNSVISPGGSIIYSEEAMEFLMKKSVVIYLHDLFENIEKRIANKETRGIIGLNKKGLKSIFNERQDLYKKYAKIIMKIPKDFDIDRIIENIIEKISDKKQL